MISAYLRVAQRRVKVWRIGSLLLLVLAGVAASELAFAGLSIEWELILGIAVVVWIPLAVKAIRRDLDVFDPLVIFAISWSIMFVARPAAMLTTGTFNVLVYNVSSGFIAMLFMALLGGIGFQLGYALPVGRLFSNRLRALPARWHSDTAVTYALLLGLCGFLLFGLFVLQAGGLNAFQQLTAGRIERQAFFLSTSSTAYLYDAIFLAFPAGLLLIATGAMRRRPLLGAIGLVLLAVVVIEEGPGGIRSWLFPIFLSPILLLYLRRNTRPGLVLVTVAAFLLFVLGVVFVGTVRNSTARNQSGVETLLTTSLTDPIGGWNRFILGWDTEMAALLALETQVVPAKIPFQHGLATGEVLVQPVPRQLWLNKPRPGNEILTKTLFVEPGIDSSSLQYSPLADFYLDFGNLGVLIGMLSLGVLASLHYQYFKRHHRSIGVQLLFASTLPFWIVLLRGSIADTFGRLVFVVPPVLVALWLAGGEKRNGEDQEMVVNPMATSGIAGWNLEGRSDE